MTIAKTTPDTTTVATAVIVVRNPLAGQGKVDDLSEAEARKAATALGGRGVRGVDPKRFGQSEARHGSASKATANDLAATIINTAPQAEEIGSEALQQAVENAAQDLLNYAQKKLMEQARKAGF